MCSSGRRPGHIRVANEAWAHFAREHHIGCPQPDGLPAAEVCAALLDRPGDDTPRTLAAIGEALGGEGPGCSAAFDRRGPGGTRGLIWWVTRLGSGPVIAIDDVRPCRGAEGWAAFATRVLEELARAESGHAAAVRRLALVRDLARPAESGAPGRGIT